MLRPRSYRTVLAALAAAAIASGAAAEDWTTHVVAAPKHYHYEAWAGADAGGHSLSVYGGMTASLSDDIRIDGWRLRSAASYGTYGYTRSYVAGNRKAWQEFRGTMHATDLMVGHHHAFGPWIVKVFAGGSQETHVVVAHGGGARGLTYDDENDVQGARMGFKGAIETWLNVDNFAFVQTDFSWSTPFKAYSSRIRTGYRLNPAFSTGLELGAHGNANHDAGRAGGFLRFEWTGGEISGAGGLGGTSHDISGAYGSLAIMMRF